MRNGCNRPQILRLFIQLLVKQLNFLPILFSYYIFPTLSVKTMLPIYPLKEKEVIVPCYHELGEFISPIFSVPKKDCSVRLIHNLKKLNSFVENSHFKMESIHTGLNVVPQIMHAYYSVKIHPDFQKIFEFSYTGTLYKYTALPNGLCTYPIKFTKMTKPPLAFLRQCGHITSGYN